MQPCPQCGTIPWPGTHTCSTCGRWLPDPDAPAPAEPTAPATPVAGPPAAPGPPPHQPAATPAPGSPAPRPAPPPPPPPPAPTAAPSYPPAGPPAYAAPSPAPPVTPAYGPPGAVPPGPAYGYPAPAAPTPARPAGGANRSVSPVVLVSCGVAVLLAFAVLGVAVVHRRNSPEPVVIQAITTPPTIEPAPTGTTRPGPGTTTRTAGGRWQPWTSPDQTFAVEFPGAPEVTEEDTHSDIISASSRAFASDLAGGFTLYWYDLADAKYAQDTGKLLDAFLDTRYDPAKVTIATRERTRVNGLPALRYSATNKILPDTTINGVMVVYRTRVFELSVLGLPGAAPDLDRFVGSFRLTKSA
jgi:hypothetical protein